jgi:hypothetical protein
MKDKTGKSLFSKMSFLIELIREILYTDIGGELNQALTLALVAPYQAFIMKWFV